MLQINARISNLRTQSKKVTDGKVEGFYQLIAGEEAIKRVKALTDENQDYIYPIKPVRFLKYLFLRSLIIGHVDHNSEWSC
jgi:hypothetical protein